MRFPYLAIIFLGLGYFAYNFVKELGFYDTFTGGTGFQCKYLNKENSVGSSEDFAFYDKNTLIVSETNLPHLFFYKGPEKTQNGKLYAIYQAQSSSPIKKEISISGFPTELKFFPFGIHYNIELNTLAVLNPTYSFGGERIELFLVEKDLKKEEISLKHMKSIVVSEEYMGRLDDIVLLNGHTIYATLWNFQADNPKGKLYNGAFYKLKLLYNTFLNNKKTYSIEITWDNTKKEKEFKASNHFLIEGSQGIMNNGIMVDNSNRLFIADTIQKKIFIFSASDKKLLRELKLQFNVDNLIFDPENNILYASGIKQPYRCLLIGHQVENNGRVSDDTEDWGVIAKIDLSQDVEKLTAIEVYSEMNGIRGISSGILMGNNLFTGSWCDHGLMICTKQSKYQKLNFLMFNNKFNRLYEYKFGGQCYVKFGENVCIKLSREKFFQLSWPTLA